MNYLNKNNKKKKAAILVDVLIGVAILVASAIILFIFIKNANLVGNVDETTCHTSLVLRHTINVKNSFQIMPIPLRCKTDKVCFIGRSSEDCSQSFSSGEKVEKIVVTKKDEILHKISDMTYECWDTLGRGYLEYNPKGFTFQKNYCAPCYRFAFSKDLANEIKLNNVTQDELFSYMQTHQIPDTSLKLTYFEFLYRTNDYQKVKSTALANGKDFSKGLISLDKEYMIITIMNKAGWAKTGIGIAIGFVALAAVPFTAGFSLTILEVAAVAGVTGGVAGGTIGFKATPDSSEFVPAFPYEYKGGEASYNELKCDKVDYMP